MIKQLLVLIALTATSAHLAMANGHPVMQQVSKADSTLYLIINTKSDKVDVRRNDTLNYVSFSFGKNFDWFVHSPCFDGKSIFLADSIFKNRKNFTIEWLSKLSASETWRYFDGTRPLYIIDISDTINGHTRAYPVTYSFDNNDLIDANLWHWSPKVGGNEPILVDGTKGLIVGKHTPYPFNHKIRGKRFTPLFEDVYKYQLNLIYKNHPDTLRPYKPLFFGAIEKGRRILYAVYLPPSQTLHNSWDSKTKSCYTNSRNAFVYEYNIAKDSLINTEFIYECKRIGNSWETYVYRRGSMLATKPLKQAQYSTDKGYINYKKKIIACIKTQLPSKAEYLQMKRGTIYAIALVDVSGKVADVAIGWFDFKSIFWERDLSKIRSCFMQETIKIASPIRSGKHRYDQPVTISISPDDWYQ